MVRITARVFLLALALALAACYRPAGEAIEPTANTGLPAAPTVDIDAVEEDATEETIPAGRAAEQADETEEPAINTGEDDDLPPITVIVPTRISQTAAPASFTTDSTAVPGTTPTYITPGVPLGPISNATATPPGGALTSTPSGLVTPTDFLSASGDSCTYIVRPGDYLYRIATDFGISLQELRAANPQLVGDPPVLQPGDEINLPCETPQPDTQQQAPSVPSPTVMPGGQVYTVKPGDTLFSISREFGVTIDAIARANNLANADVLDVGQQLIIPPPGG